MKGLYNNDVLLFSFVGGTTNEDILNWVKGNLKEFDYDNLDLLNDPAFMCDVNMSGDIILISGDETYRELEIKEVAVIKV